MPCPACPCPADTSAHAITAALREDDLDRAIDLGLLDAVPCPGCGEDCNHALIAARDARRLALAARERFRARQQRLHQRTRERAQKRAAAATLPSALPPAASAALARAKARATKP